MQKYEPTVSTHFVFKTDSHGFPVHSSLSTTINMSKYVLIFGDRNFIRSI